MNNQLKIYLAGPCGFSESGRYFYYNKIIEAIKKLGFKYFDPWNTIYMNRIKDISSMKYGIKKKTEWEQLNLEIGKLNKFKIDKCDLLLAVLDGSDVDSGTAAEIGYAFAKKKKIIGYRGDLRLSADNEGCTVNLQVEYFIKSSGGIITRDLNELISCLRDFIE